MVFFLFHHSLGHDHRFCIKEDGQRSKVELTRGCAEATATACGVSQTTHTHTHTHTHTGRHSELNQAGTREGMILRGIDGRETGAKSSD